SIEPLLMSLYEFKARIGGSIFLDEVLKSSEVLYEMDCREARSLEAWDYVDLAEDFLKYAEGAASRGELRPAIDEAYNAIELCIKALILIKGKELARSHGGIVQQFGRLFVLTGEVEREVGKEIRRALITRNRARYDPRAEVRDEDASRVLSIAKRLVAKARATVTGQRPGAK
ncbi:TPA: HEPN domain-containing protein, partial [Candidatus Bathyarchaeota archaeon]|nr:HEPN domain-containing protein [Candidatus Bathyarchaeota archaeon]